ncbi:hypothetical protein [Desulfofustis limnaeus]|uniref:Uncharacterized protein n=1 Tax=Desulfofustis limnaeus TaxID=2740163 RepID=A0ABM7WCL7_9BACT|nr:hypothetical protein [Desulfofustis limnaeus]BDD88696.1 hypothetical protein DPPLL_30610 [Desulfofustis limnaeus]
MSEPVKRIIVATEVEYEPLADSEKFTEEEQIDQCCEEVSVDECADVGKVSRFISRDQEEWDFDPDALAAEYEQQYGKKFLGVELHAVGPQGDCGVKEETWEGRLNCCDEVEPLAIDTERSVSVLAPGEHGNVYFTGGRFPVLVKLRGNGFTLDGYNQRDGWVDGPHQGFTVYAHEFACGAAPITLDDGCSVASHQVRSTEGEWYGDCWAYYYEGRGPLRYTVGGCAHWKLSNCNIISTGKEPNSPPVWYYDHVGFWAHRWDTVNHWWLNYGGTWSSSVCADETSIALLDFLDSLDIPKNKIPSAYLPNGPEDGAQCGDCRYRCP